MGAQVKQDMKSMGKKKEAGLCPRVPIDRSNDILLGRSARALGNVVRSLLSILSVFCAADQCLRLLEFVLHAKVVLSRMSWNLKHPDATEPRMA